MIANKSVLAIIPARGGSKRVPRKNIRPLAGKPLIAWTIEEAKKSKFIDRLILSSEDEEIINVAKSYGCEIPFVRPIELAQDDTLGKEPIIHALKELPGYDHFVLLQPTSPFRNVDDIDGCIRKCQMKSAPACVSVTDIDKSPYWMYLSDSEDRMRPFLPSQNFPMKNKKGEKIFVLNGAVFVAERNFYLETEDWYAYNSLSYFMPKERSVDIDDECDFNYAEFLVSNKTVPG